MASNDTPVPEVRIRALCDVPAKASGAYVLYWMTSARRSQDNFALQRAVEFAVELDKPLVVLEALRLGYRWASDRFHAFVLQGMAANERAFDKTRAHYYPYVETSLDAGKGLLDALAQDACVLFSDDYPCFFIPDMLGAATEKVAERHELRFEVVDANGVFPMRATDKSFSRAFDFRRYLQRELKPHLEHTARRDPLQGDELRKLGGLPAALRERWPRADARLLAESDAALASLPLEQHGLAEFEGGSAAGAKALERFIDTRLDCYGERRNHPDERVTSELSSYLHFGHVAGQRVVLDVLSAGGGSVAGVGGEAKGAREGWWNASESAEAFLDQIVTWREIGFNRCAHDADFDKYDTLPAWSQKTLAEHSGDERPYLYTREQFENSQTHDELWNAAQNELRLSGRMHNYLRMLWGKKILEWSASPREALGTLIELNNKYAVDGRDPNSYSGIFWTLGRYDRAWGPERPIIGKVRYMTSDSTRRKVRLREYLAQWSGRGSGSEATLF